MRKIAREKRLKKIKRSKSNFFNQFKNLEKDTVVVGDFQKDFECSINLLFDDLSIVFYNDEYKQRFIIKKWNNWKTKIFEFLNNILLDDIAKRYYNLNNHNINEQLIKRYYINYLNKENKIKNEDESEEIVEIKESDITDDQLKEYWRSTFKSIIIVIGLEKELHQDIVLENVQKKWF